jgi:hypothetical protein
VKLLTVVECWRSVCLPVHMAQRPFRVYDDMRECCERVVATRVAKRPEHVFREVVHVVDPTVVPIEGNLKVFPCCLYSICRAHCDHETS